jgi:hypothetical protein
MVVKFLISKQTFASRIRCDRFDDAEAKFYSRVSKTCDSQHFHWKGNCLRTSRSSWSESRLCVSEKKENFSCKSFCLLGARFHFPLVNHRLLFAKLYVLLKRMLFWSSNAIQISLRSRQRRSNKFKFDRNSARREALSN